MSEAKAAAGTDRRMPDRRTAVQTFTGKWVDVGNPQVAAIDPVDIAHALSQICRFNGHTRYPYSVAQHSVLVSRAVRDALVLETDEERRAASLAALLHDAHEAYVMDVPTPIKRLLPGYAAIEAGMLSAVARRFGLDPSDEVRYLIARADRKMLATEVRDLMPTGSAGQYHERSRMVEPFPWHIDPWEPREAEKAFLSLFRSLYTDEDAPF